MKDHPIAGLFPLATKEELAALAEDISEHGQIETIEIYEGKILDGRNRYRACSEAGVEPRCEEWHTNGSSPVDYVISKNLHRRHLTIPQRAALGVKLLDYERREAAKRQHEGRKLGGKIKANPALGHKQPQAERDKKRAAAIVGKKLGIGRTTVLAAELVAKASPRTFRKLEKGEISVSAAASEAGVGTGTYTKRIRTKQSAADVQEQATPANNIEAAHFYTGLASNAIVGFDLIPKEEIDALIPKAEEASKWWVEIVSELNNQKENGS